MSRAAILILTILCIASTPLMAAKPASKSSLDEEDRARLRRVIGLSKTGASQLAQQLVDTYQPPEQWIESWMLWERQRFVILKNRGDWQAMLQRTAALPGSVSVEFHQWVLEQAVEASLRLGQADQARTYLRKLLFARREIGKDGKPVKSDQQHEKDVARWRRLVIRSFLRDNRAADANLALSQYIEDYKPRSPDWAILQARVQMLNNQHDKAFETLSGIDRHESKMLQQLTALRGKLIAADKIIATTTKLQKRIKPESQLYQQSLSLLSEAAIPGKHDWLKVEAMENILQAGGGRQFDDDVYQSITGDNLLSAYRKTAERWGNNKRLLVGDDKAWLKAATQADKKKKRLLARSIYALVMQTGTDENKIAAITSLIDSLITDDRDKVVYALFNGKAYADASVLPALARFSLAEYALQRRFINMAGRMIEGLGQPPKDNKQGVDWPLRQARILVYSGMQEAAVSKLNEYISAQKIMTAEQAEYTSNVIFDLQAVEKHKDVIKLLKHMLNKVRDKEAQRRLYFWMADSWKAEGEYARAAELYLRSAYHGQPGGGDHWGQTARFHAAEILAKGGMTDDARHVYGSLMQGTQDARRRSMLEQRIEQLWLYRKNQSDIPLLFIPQ